MRCRLHQDRQGTRRTEVTARPEHSSAPMNLHPRWDTPVPQNQQTPTATSPAAGVFHSRPFMSALSHATVFPSHPTLFHNGSNFRISLPLRRGLSHDTPAAGLLDSIAILFLFHNGSNFRISLPLRHDLSRDTPAAGLLDGIAILFLFHNGTLSSDSLPLRQLAPEGADESCFSRHLPEPAGTVSLSVNRMPSRWSTSCWKMTAV